jgi:DNA-directed RNA polymerase specialized sigma24 family protein
LDSKYGAAATLDQIENAIECLTDAEWARLRKMANANLWGTRLDDPEELVNETFERLISGSRTWNTGMAFVPWMRSAMKSIADGLRNRKAAKLEATATDLADDCDPDAAPEVFGSEETTPLDLLLTEEARAMAESDLAKIEAHFKGNQNVELILMGIEDGLKPEEVREIGGLTLTQYETTRKQLRRGLDRLFRTRREK